MTKGGVELRHSTHKTSNSMKCERESDLNAARFKMLITNFKKIL